MRVSKIDIITALVLAALAAAQMNYKPVPKPILISRTWLPVSENEDGSIQVQYERWK